MKTMADIEFEEVEEFVKPYKVERRAGCWLWKGGLMNGYGQVQVQYKRRLVHDLVYEHFIGPIPDKHEVHHTCEIRNCIRHLEALTKSDHQFRHVRSRRKNNGLRK